MSKVFKVFRRLPGSSDLFSLTKASGARVRYEEGEEAKPNSGEGALFAFESYEAARAFQVCGDEIWECFATNVRLLGWRAAHENLGRIRRGFWQMLSPEEYNSQLRPKSLAELDYYSQRLGEVVARTPEGTVVCDSVTPLTRIG